MPNLPISQLSQSTTLQGDELFVDVQDSITKYTTLDDITGYITGSFDYITPSQTGSFINTNYGLYNQTGSSTPIVGVSGSIAVSGSLLDGGLGTLTIPANGFNIGDAFHARMSGKITIANNHDLDIHFDTGNITLVDVGPITMAGSTNKNWSLEVTFIIQNTGSAGTASILSSGDLTVRTDSSGDVVTEIFSSVNNTTFDTTISNTLEITGILEERCGTSENIYSEMFILHKIY